MRAPSQLPPAADMPLHGLRTEKCQQPTSRSAATESLLDHLVGAQRECRRYCQPDLLRSLHVDHQLEFGGRLHRELAWLLTFEDEISVPCRAPPLIDLIWSVCHQPALCREISERVDCRETVPRRQLYDRTAIGHEDGMRCNEQAAIRLSCKRADGALDLYAVVDAGTGHLDPERWCGCLGRMQERDIVGG